MALPSAVLFCPAWPGKLDNCSQNCWKSVGQCQNWRQVLSVLSWTGAESGGRESRELLVNFTVSETGVRWGLSAHWNSTRPRSHLLAAQNVTSHNLTSHILPLTSYTLFTLNISYMLHATPQLDDQLRLGSLYYVWINGKSSSQVGNGIIHFENFLFSQVLYWN